MPPSAETTEATAAVKTATAETAATMALCEGRLCRECQCAKEGEACNRLFQHSASPDPVAPHALTPMQALGHGARGRGTP